VSNFADIYEFNPFRLDVRERRLLRGGVEITLRPRVFDTLCFLVKHSGRLVTKEELLQGVWPDAAVEENNLTHNISILRKALGEGATGQSFIETVPRIGYRFSAQVAHRNESQVDFAADPRRVQAEPMQRQEIRFCTATDGVRLAYATIGKGFPIIKAANWLNHLDFE